MGKQTPNPALRSCLSQDGFLYHEVLSVMPMLCRAWEIVQYANKNAFLITYYYYLLALVALALVDLHPFCLVLMLLNL